MSDYNIYWGDLHSHLENIEKGDMIMNDARDNIDFYAVLCYPFIWEKKGGVMIETVRQRPKFLEWWKKHQEFARSYYKPSSFVTFLGYEWHGNRSHYGDHNVIYFDEDNPLDDTWKLEDLYKNLQNRKAIAIPHHTAYCKAHRGKDWDIYNEALSPVMEVFSIHGSSEGFDTPFPLEPNPDMAPRTTGGTYQDALARGYRIGVIGSNDLAGLPGRWGCGRAGVLAKECTREAIWEALLARRTYAVTGDRMELDFRINREPMGSIIKGGGSVDVDVAIIGSHAIDRIELLQNGYVIDTYCHSGKWERKAEEAKKFKVFFEAGWGPAKLWGLNPKDGKWSCKIDVEAGRLASVEKCFSIFGQKIKKQDEKHCDMELITPARVERIPFGMKQGVVFELEGDSKTRFKLQAEGIKIDLSVTEMLKDSHFVPLLEEAKNDTLRISGLKDEEIENKDIYFINTRKMNLFRAIPENGYQVSHTFRNIKLEKGRNYFYVRTSQLNNQYAWSSPIWVDNET